MTIPEHLPWNNGDPQYRGWFDFTSEPGALTIEAGGYVDLDIESAVINMIYRLRITTASSNSYSISFYDKSARTSDDICWQNSGLTGNYNSVTSEDGLIVQVGKDGTNSIFMRISGTPGDVFTPILDLVRLR